MAGPETSQPSGTAPAADSETATAAAREAALAGGLIDYDSRLQVLKRCMDCGNQAKRDCTFSRCRACCRFHAPQTDCPVHPRSKSIPPSLIGLAQPSLEPNAELSFVATAKKGKRAYPVSSTERAMFHTFQPSEASMMGKFRLQPIGQQQQQQQPEPQQQQQQQHFSPDDAHALRMHAAAAAAYQGHAAAHQPIHQQLAQLQAQQQFAHLQQQQLASLQASMQGDKVGEMTAQQQQALLQQHLFLQQMQQMQMQQSALDAAARFRSQASSSSNSATTSASTSYQGTPANLTPLGQSPFDTPRMQSPYGSPFMSPFATPLATPSGTPGASRAGSPERAAAQATDGALPPIMSIFGGMGISSPNSSAASSTAASREQSAKTSPRSTFSDPAARQAYSRLATPVSDLVSYTRNLTSPPGKRGAAKAGANAPNGETGADDLLTAVEMLAGLQSRPDQLKKQSASSQKRQLSPAARSVSAQDVRNPARRKSGNE